MLTQIQTIEGKVLYLIYDLYIKDQITLHQKGLLKDSLIGKQNNGFNKALTRFKQNHDYMQFTRFLKESSSCGYCSILLMLNLDYSQDDSFDMSSKRQKYISPTDKRFRFRQRSIKQQKLKKSGKIDSLNSTNHSIGDGFKQNIAKLQKRRSLTMEYF